MTSVFVLVVGLIGFKAILTILALLATGLDVRQLSKYLKDKNLPGWRTEFPDLSMQERIDSGYNNWKWNWRHLIYVFQPDESTNPRLVYLRRRVLILFFISFFSLALTLLDIAIVMTILFLTYST